MIRTEKAEGLRPRPIPFRSICRPRAINRAGGSRGPLTCSHASQTGPRQRGSRVSNGAAREVYGMAVTVLASSSLFSLRRCVSKRSPTLNDVTFWMVRPARL
jgi:hypothetical protein